MVRTVVVGEPSAEIAEWLQRRRALGQDLFDEVWDGEYHVVPAPHRRHGDVEAQLGVLLHPGNFRVPDRSYFAERSAAVYEPTAVLVVEIVSPDDESYATFDFYFAHGVAEVLIVDPKARSVQWYRRSEERYSPAVGSAILDFTSERLAAAIDWPD